MDVRANENNNCIFFLRFFRLQGYEGSLLKVTSKNGKTASVSVAKETVIFIVIQSHSLFIQFFCLHILQYEHSVTLYFFAFYFETSYFSHRFLFSPS